MKIILALDKDCKVVDWDVVTDKNKNEYLATYKAMWYDAFNVEDLWEEYDYLEDNMYILWSIISLASSFGMSVKDFMDFLDKDIGEWDWTDAIRDKLYNKIHEVANRDD